MDYFDFEWLTVVMIERFAQWVNSYPGLFIFRSGMDAVQSIYGDRSKGSLLSVTGNMLETQSQNYRQETLLMPYELV